MSEDQHGAEISKKRRGSKSLFGAIVLIAFGVYFLLYNFDMIPGPDWQILLLFWPVLLIFAGLNILAQSFPRPWGSLLSALIGIAAVAFFAWILFFGGSEWLYQQFKLPDVDTSIFEFFP